MMAKCAYERIHGQIPNPRAIEFGERILFFVPKRRRAKLDRKYAEGIYLGSSLNSNEHVIARADGFVTRARSVARVPSQKRWDPKLLANVRGTPAKPIPPTEDDALLEEHLQPHVDADDDLKDLLEQEGLDIGPGSNWYKRFRIQKTDIKQHGYTPTCIRCTRLQLGDHKTTENQ